MGACRIQLLAFADARQYAHRVIEFHRSNPQPIDRFSKKKLFFHFRPSTRPRAQPIRQRIDLFIRGCRRFEKLLQNQSEKPNLRNFWIRLEERIPSSCSRYGCGDVSF